MNLSSLLQMQGMLIIIMVLGLFLARMGTITPEGRQLLTDLVINVTLPCSIVKAFLIEFSMDILQSCIAIFLAAIVIQFLGMGLSHILYPGYEGQRKRVLQYATICSNAGILGNPIAEGAFGSIGLMYASIYLIPQRSFMWSFGLTYFTVSPSRWQLIKKILTHPCIIAVELGLVLLIGQFQLPGVISDTISSLGSANTSVSMLLIGAILSTVDLKKMVDRDSLYYCAVRLILIPGLVYLGCRIAGLEEMVTGVSVLLSAMPAASVTAVMASKYQQDAPFAAKIVALSTILSMITAPLWCLLFV